MRINKKVFPTARFGKLVVIQRLPVDRGMYKVLCKCDCGNEVGVMITRLGNGKQLSCNGCSRLTPGKGYSLIKSGAVFGRLTVIERIQFEGNLTASVLCQCVCGKTSKSNIDGLLSGATRSCGCLSREKVSQRNKESGKFGGFSGEDSFSMSAWRSLMNRCYNPNQKAYYQAYGGKGVIVCKYLKECPQNLVLVLGKRTEENPSLDRFPIHDGNYTCGKCEECERNEWDLNIRWTTRKEQCLNRGKFNKYLTAFGKTLTKSQWGEITGMGWGVITSRMKRGWDHEKILSTPDRFGNCYKP